MDPVEIVAALLGVAFVLLTMRQSVWCWPVGIANCVLYIVVFAQAKLYSDAVLQVVFVGMSVYGWYHWLYPSGRRDDLPVTRTPLAEALALALAWAVGTALWGTAMVRLGAAFPYLDSAMTMGSLVAQWLLTRKRVENWAVWIAVDLVYIGIYLAKDLVPTAILYAVFTGLAAAGLRAWWRELT